MFALTVEARSEVKTSSSVEERSSSSSLAPSTCATLPLSETIVASIRRYNDGLGPLVKKLEGFVNDEESFFLRTTCPAKHLLMPVMMSSKIQKQTNGYPRFSRKWQKRRLKRSSKVNLRTRATLLTGKTLSRTFCKASVISLPGT